MQAPAFYRAASVAAVNTTVFGLTAEFTLAVCEAAGTA